MQLRWMLTHATARPCLQFRTCVIEPHWGEWQDVPMVMVPPPAQAVITPADLAALPLPNGWTRAEDGRLIPPPDLKAEAQAARKECPDCHIPGGCVIGQCSIGCFRSERATTTGDSNG